MILYTYYSESSRPYGCFQRWEEVALLPWKLEKPYQAPSSTLCPGSSCKTLCAVSPFHAPSMFQRPKLKADCRESIWVNSKHPPVLLSTSVLPQSPETSGVMTSLHSASCPWDPHVLYEEVTLKFSSPKLTLGWNSVPLSKEFYSMSRLSGYSY